MTDNHSREIRSYNMSRIRSIDTTPELIVRKYLFRNNFRYRLHDKKLPGKPDIILKKYKTVVFVHGCFWHGHLGCKKFVIPKTNTIYWKPKIEKNRERDVKNTRQLKSLGWNIIIIYECQLSKSEQETTLNELIISLNNN